MIQCTMPLPYIAFHVGLSILCTIVTLRIAKHNAARTTWALIAFVVVVGGLAIERRNEWAWSAFNWGMPNLVYFINQSLLGALVLTALMFSMAIGTWAKLRAIVLGLPLLGAALWSYSWLYEPAPPNLRGHVDKSGYCPQTSPDTCAAASAAMLLHSQGIKATEQEMAALCLTRQHKGTTPLGLYRGLALKGAQRRCTPREFKVSSPAQLRTPCIIEVGLARNVSPNIAGRMKQYGWAPGVLHAVFIGKADPHGKWIDVADPSVGRERWPTKGIEYLWDGREVTLDSP